MKLYVPMLKVANGTITLGIKKKEVTLVADDAQPSPPKPKKKFRPKVQLWEKTDV
jgi:hypothetical protein